MCRNPQKAKLFENQRTALEVCLLLFERYCLQSIVTADSCKGFQGMANGIMLGGCMGVTSQDIVT